MMPLLAVIGFGFPVAGERTEKVGEAEPLFIIF